jgi:hypothetical protein
MTDPLMTDPLMTDPLSLAELLDTNTYRQNPPKSSQQWGREQQSQRLGLGDSLTVRDVLL